VAIVLLRRRGERQRARGAFRLPADVLHQDGDIGAFDGLQRRGHGEIHVLSISPYHVRINPARPHRRPEPEVRNEQPAKP
jgi:hypothetical protein